MRADSFNGDTLSGPPHPVLVTIPDNKDYSRVLLYPHYTTITGCGVLLRHIIMGSGFRV